MISESPHAALLGMCLADPKAFERSLARGVTVEMFPDPEHREIFQAMLEAERSGRRVSVRSLAVGLPHLVVKLTALRESAHVTIEPDYFVAEILARVWAQDAAFKLHELKQLVLARKAFSDVSGIKATLSQSLDQLLRGVDGSSAGPRHVTEILDVELLKMEQEILAQDNGKLAGIPTGITVLDRLTSGGLKRGSVNVFAARTGMGKTTLALNLAHHAACEGFAVCYFTVEMPAGQLTRKLLSLVSAIKGRKLTAGDLTDEERDRLCFAASALHKRPIWIDDSFKARFEAFELSCRKLKRQGHLDVLVVDYVQQLTLEGRYQTKTALVTEVSYRLKQLALELDVAVISLAQFNRNAEAQGGEPSIWQVKDSGAIEQDADLGVCLYRDANDKYMLKVDKNRWGRDRVKFPIDADLSVNAFRNLNLNLPEEY